MPKKSKEKSKPSNRLKDTPPPERYARIIAEEFNTKFELLQENLQTIGNSLSKETKEFAMQVMKEFARIDLRFMAVEQKFDKMDKRFEQVDKRFEQVDEQFKVVNKELREIREEVQKTHQGLSGRIDSLEERVEVLEENAR